MDNLFNQALSAVVTLCGLGYVNWAALRWLDVIEETENKSYQLGFVSLLSVVDWIVYLLIEAGFVSLGLRGNGLSAAAIFATMVVSFLLTLLLGQPVGKLIQKMLNARRKSLGKPNKYMGRVVADIMDPDKHLLSYLYDLDRKPLGFGYVYETNVGNDAGLEFAMEPCADDDGNTQPEYDDLVAEMQKTDFQKKYSPTQYINFKEKYIVITLDTNAAS